MPDTKRRLGWCWQCKENSVYSKTNKEKGYTLSYCINKGCGYKTTMPYPLVIPNATGDIMVRIQKAKDVCECGMEISEAEKYCMYVNSDCHAYCVRNSIDERGQAYE